jgi:hypothetical protein
MRRFLAPPATRSVEPAPAPTFSVVVAAYQVADVIGDALESVRRQTLAPLEVIVCDDGSTDDLDRALAPFIERITLIRKENGGEATAKNAAADEASGDFLVILDADDVYLPGRLAALAELASARPDLDVLTSDAVLEVDGEAVRRCYTPELPFEVEDQRSAILRRNFVFGLAAVRRERFLDGSQVGAVLEPLARYRLRAGSLSGSRANLLAGRVRVLENAAAHPSLSDAERRTVTESIALERRRLALAEARAALEGELPHPRRLALKVAFGRGYGLPTRLKSLAAAAAPGWAGSRLAASDRETTGGVRLPAG